MMIKVLKEGNRIYKNLEKEFLDPETNQVISNIPTDLATFQAMAIDTVEWQIGDNVKKAIGNVDTKLSASNAKAIALLAKIINTLNPDTSNLTPLEFDSWNKLLNLANNGYADSKLLNSSLDAVDSYIKAGVNKIERVKEATTIDEIIAILNED